jgi:vacuolar-type H+-ATPase subunit I/STV1
MRELKMTYLDKVQEQVNEFVNSNIKYDYLRPGNELTLQLTLQQAEQLASANDEIKALAANGDLKTIHENVISLTEKVETEYLKIRDLLDKMLTQLDEKENHLYEQIEELSGKKLFKHGDEKSLFDIISGNTPNPSLTNLATLDSIIHHTEDASEKASYQSL